MTKLWIQSDQHYEIYGKPMQFPIPEADVFVCAGDLMREPADAVMWLDVTVPFPTIYVAGNHEYYRGIYTKWRDAGAVASAERPKVDLLENSVSVTGGVRFVGCTLWTDFSLYGPEFVETSKNAAYTGMNDFVHITYSTGVGAESWRKQPLKPNHVVDIHLASRAFLEDELSKPFSGKKPWSSPIMDRIRSRSIPDTKAIRSLRLSSRISQTSLSARSLIFGSMVMCILPSTTWSGKHGSSRTPRVTLTRIQISILPSLSKSRG